MGQFCKFFSIGFLGAAALISVGTLHAKAAPVAAIQPGAWQLSEVGSRKSTRVCAADLARLTVAPSQSAHCAAVEIETGRRLAVYEYTCAGVGRGRSVATIIDDSTVRLETQGVSQGVPFAVDYDARRVGGCN